MLDSVQIDNCEHCTQMMGIQKLLRTPNIAIVAIGSLSCLRGLCDFIDTGRLFLLPVGRLDVVMANHTSQIKDTLEHIIRHTYKRIVLYLSCIDEVVAISYEQIISILHEKYGGDIELFHRGPSVKEQTNVENQLQNIKDIWSDD